MLETREGLRSGIGEKTRYLTIARYLAAPLCENVPVDVKHHRTNTEPIYYPTSKKAQTHIFFANMCLASAQERLFCSCRNSPRLLGHRLYDAPIKIRKFPPIYTICLAMYANAFSITHLFAPIMQRIKEAIEKTEEFVKSLYWIIADYDAVNKQGKDYPYAVTDQLVKTSWHLREAAEEAEKYIKKCPEVNRNLYKEYDITI